MSTVNSWGPTNELGPYPHFAAPGGDIFSTLPLAQGGFGVLSGTSMAAPYISGVVALYLSSKGASDPITLRNLLSSTASSVNWNDGIATFKDLKAPTAQQGSGLIRADRFMEVTSLVSPGFISLNV